MFLQGHHSLFMNAMTWVLIKKTKLLQGHIQRIGGGLKDEGVHGFLGFCCFVCVFLR